jgi:hypothetical protein
MNKFSFKNMKIYFKRKKINNRIEKYFQVKNLLDLIIIIKVKIQLFSNLYLDWLLIGNSNLFDRQNISFTKISIFKGVTHFK